jgi:putative transposase
MYNVERLSHTTWDCKYHLIWIPKYRKNLIYGELRKYLGDIFRDLSAQKENRVVEGHLMADHVHMLVSIPPKYSVSQWGSSSARVLFTLQGIILGARGTSRGSIFGQEATTCLQSAKMKGLFANTSKDRKRKTAGLIS